MIFFCFAGWPLRSLYAKALPEAGLARLCGAKLHALKTLRFSLASQVDTERVADLLRLTPHLTRLEVLAPSQEMCGSLSAPIVQLLQLKRLYVRQSFPVISAPHLQTFVRAHPLKKPSAPMDAWQWLMLLLVSDDLRHLADRAENGQVLDVMPYGPAAVREPLQRRLRTGQACPRLQRLETSCAWPCDLLLAASAGWSSLEYLDVFVLASARLLRHVHALLRQLPRLAHCVLRRAAMAHEEAHKDDDEHDERKEDPRLGFALPALQTLQTPALDVTLFRCPELYYLELQGEQALLPTMEALAVMAPALTELAIVNVHAVASSALLTVEKHHAHLTDVTLERVPALTNHVLLKLLSEGPKITRLALMDCPHITSLALSQLAVLSRPFEAVHFCPSDAMDLSVCVMV